MRVRAVVAPLLGGCSGIAAAAGLWRWSAAGVDLVVGPVWTPHLVGALLIGGAALLSLAAFRALEATRGGPPRDWSTLLADGATALQLLGLLGAATVVGVGCWWAAAGTSITTVPGSGGGCLIREDRPFAGATTRAVGVRRGPVVVWSAASTVEAGPDIAGAKRCAADLGGRGGGGLPRLAE